MLPPGFKDGLAERYRIQRELGRGGMATVYLAEDVKHRRRVAIKVLSPELASVLGHDRFLREIEIAAQLTHPHILPLHDSGTSAGLLYYVMPYIEGETLRARVSREKQLPLDEAVEITRKGAEGFITKPFLFEELLHELNAALEKRRLRAENACSSPLSTGTARWDWYGFISPSFAIPSAE